MKIWNAAPVPLINHAPSGTMAETAAPGTAKNLKAMTSEAARAARRRHLRNGLEPACAQFALPPDYAMTLARLSRNSEREAPDVPVHQPPDREDDKDQPEYAADPDGSALTVIAAAVEPKPASKENQEQHDDQN